MGSESKARQRARWYRVARMYAPGLPEDTSAAELRKILRMTARGQRATLFSARREPTPLLLSPEHARIVADALS